MNDGWLHIQSEGVGVMWKNDDGYIVVETVGTFIPFLLLVISILSLVNIVSVQARVHHALTQAGNTLSMYSYVLKATGVSDSLVTLDSKGNVLRENILSVIDGIESLNFGDVDLDFEISPEGIMNYGLNEARNLASAGLVRPMVMRYLSGSKLSGEEYLSNANVSNFYLTRAMIVDQNENVKLTIEYEVDYSFGVLRLPFGPRLRITQTVVTKAWLTGSGEGYW